MKYRWMFGLVLLFSVAISACRDNKVSGNKVTLNGAGATFPYPIYSKWFDEYGKSHPNVSINYQSIGSGGGIRQLLAGTVDFGASDMPMTDQQLSEAKTGILHVPTVLGAVVPIYNISGFGGSLAFTPQILAGIYSGKIKFWDDEEIFRVNLAQLPHEDILVVHRSDGSGTTFIFTDFLSKTNPDWKNKVGASTAISWPAGVGAKGNEGVAGLVKQSPGAIGYVELIYATQNNLPYGSVQNKAGKFIKAGLDTITAAASGFMKDMPSDFRVSIVNAPGDSAYPISSFTWLLVSTKFEDVDRWRALTDFLFWMLDSGQAMAPHLNYAPLPDALRRQIRDSMKKNLRR